MAQAVSRLAFTAEIRTRMLGNPCGICGMHWSVEGVQSAGSTLRCTLVLDHYKVSPLTFIDQVYMQILNVASAVSSPMHRCLLYLINLTAFSDE